MGNTTLSGPLRVGPIREGASANIGTVVLAQSAAYTQSTTAASTGIIVPANSQVLSMTMYLTVAPDGASQNLSIGTSSASNEWVTAVALGTSADVTVDLMSGTNVDVDLFENVGTSDVTIWLDTSAGSAGTGTFTVTYITT